MRTLAFWAVLLAVPALDAGEAGFELPFTVSAGGFYSHRGRVESPVADTLRGGFRGVIYPSFKLGRHWFAYAAVQVQRAPYFYENLASPSSPMRLDVLQGFAGYQASGRGNSIMLRAGQLVTAFGSFPLRYDDHVNPLIDVPSGYGQYYSPVTTYGLPGVQLDATVGRLDGRIQFTNSSPANRRGLWEPDEYGAWAGGLGFTVKQGFRVGTSAYRGAYLHREHRFFFPGEKAPRSLPSTGLGADIQWARGRLYANAEAQRFQLAYTVFPTITAWYGYGELKYVLSPRWYVAYRQGHRRTNLASFVARDVYEAAIGIRPNRHQLIKLGYELVRGPDLRGSRDNVLGIQYIVYFDSLPVASW